MPRVGKNPLMGTRNVRQPEKITAAMIVCIPYLSGYWEQTLDVLKICIRSVRENTKVPFDLMIFDNASCEEVRGYLVDSQQHNLIQYLILSDRNIGKLGAWNVILAGAPGESIAYSDSDVLFLPHWLERSLDVLKAFPEAGMVTAQPSGGEDLEVDSATLRGIEHNDTLRIEKGDFVPKNYRIAQRYGRGIGDDDQERHMGAVIRVIRGNVEAYVGAGHFQFLVPKPTLTSLLPLETAHPIGADRQFDRRLNAAGYWRLTTTDYLVHHMGNRVPTAANNYDGLNWLDAAQHFQEHTDSSPPKANEARSEHSLLRYVLRQAPAQKLLRSVNRLTYNLLSRT
jgi:glycosyltransferase involved in cell wall biosynthesis